MLIKFDGEMYELTLPYDDVMRNMNAEWKDDLQMVYSYMDHCFVRSKSAGRLDVKYFIPRYENPIRNKMQVPFGTQVPGNYRPMLTPLDKEGNLLVGFRKHNPNGTILHGGTLYMGGIPQRQIDPAFFNGETITIGETIEGLELTWLVWDGKMISIKPLLLIRHTENILTSMI